ncbi:MAG: COR domain-containing protein [Chitinophagales bacterium]
MKNDLTQAKRLIAECLETQNTYLDLGNCGITDLTGLSELFECRHIETLILSHRWWDLEKRKWVDSENKGKKNELKALPAEIAVFQQLKTLIVSLFFKIENPDISFLAKLESLTTLDLSNNQISDISFLAKLENLTILDLSNNQISDISFLAKLENLTTLKLHSNQISDISFLAKLENLTTLDLYSNQVSDINFLAKLENLTTLELSYNQISEISEAFFKRFSSYNLEEFGEGEGLNIGKNPIISPPMEILEQGRRAVLDWYEADKKELKEIKVILLGDPKAGKTSLLKRLKDNDFDKDEEQTDGINIERIEFAKHDTFTKEKALHGLTAYFWDFGGQEIMNATHQFFLTKRSVYVLVLDARKDKGVATQIREWLQRIRATGGDSLVIVAVNQIDVNRGFGFENQDELEKEFPQIKAFIKISCKTKKKLKKLKSLLAELIPQAEMFHTEIDERWLPLKEALQKETKAEHYLTEKEFNSICKTHGLQKKSARKSAIKFLHDLGLVLHFDDIKMGNYSENVSLSNYFVLDPYWITSGVYQILTSKEAAKHKGKVCMTKLDFIVNEEADKKTVYCVKDQKRIEYTEDEMRFLVKILYRFKLCFYVDGRNQFILPDLLDTKKPKQLTQPIEESSNSIRFVYKYNYLPKYIIPYIIVETHELAIAQWRTGCVVQKKKCSALIFSYNNEITIVVSSKDNNGREQRSLMDIMRYLMGIINDTLTEKPKMLIPLPETKEHELYKILLNREKQGDVWYKKDFVEGDNVTTRKYEISKLLEGISKPSELALLGKEIKKEFEIVKANQELLFENQELNQSKISAKMDEYSVYIVEKLKKDKRIEHATLAAVLDIKNQILPQMQAEISADIMQMLTKVFMAFDGEMDEKLQCLYEDLKKKGNAEMKIKLGIPFISLLGLDIGIDTSFDIKSWAKQMCDKYELEIFEAIGLL